MAGFLVYSLSTGIIDRTGSVPDGQESLQALAGEAVMLNDDPSVSGTTHWVNLGPPPVLMIKSVMSTSIDRTYIAAGLSQVATITGVPQGANLSVNGVDKGRVDDGVVTFSASAIASYALQLTHYRYQPQNYTVDVGVAHLSPATETERGGNIAFPLPPALEIEAALDAGQIRTAQLTIVTETETALAAGMIITGNLDLSVETESAIDASAPLVPASETEAALDLVVSRTAQLTPAAEVETALDVAA